MKQKLVKLVSYVMVCAFFVMFSQTYAMPAYNKPLKVQQSDGTFITVRLFGDEHFSYARTLDGYTLIANDRGDWHYAVKDAQGDLVMSDIRAHDEMMRTKQEMKFLLTIAKGENFSQKQLSKQAAKRKAATQAYAASPMRAFAKKDPKFLVVLVSYKDVEFDSANAVKFRHQIQDSNYTSNGYTGSVRDYFHDQSFGTIYPQFDVYGPVTLPKNRSYYAANDNAKAWEMIKDAVNILDSTTDVNYADYDNDKDGFVDLVHVIFAGQGSNTTGNKNAQIWPHMFFFNQTIKLDGKTFYKYACSSETNGYLGVDGIGAVCHEMGHAFGLPDMYDTGNKDGQQTAITPGSWDIMDAGSYNNNSKTPPYYSMVERDMLGWGEIQQLQNGENILYPLADSNRAYKIHLNDDEYLMFEYRVKKKWDKYVPGEGMMVFHADTSQFVNWEQHNSVNDDPEDRGYYVEPACDESKVQTAAAPYPGTTNKTEIEYFFFTNGKVAQGTVTNIVKTDTAIIFNYSPVHVVEFTLNDKNSTLNSAQVYGSFTSEQNMTDRTLEYKKISDKTYTQVPVSDDTFTYDLTGLEKNTAYNYRLSAKVGEKTYYSIEKVLHTECYDGVITEFPWQDGFENGLTCWTQKSSTSTTYWTAKERVLSGNYSSKKGSYSATLKFTPSYWGSASNSRLISPVMDFSKLGEPYVSFQYIVFSSANDPLTVYYRESETASWVKIETFKSPSSVNSVKWKKTKVAIPTKSATAQISFVGKDLSYYGVALDEIEVYDNNPSASLNDVQSNIFVKVVPNPSNEDAVLFTEGLQGNAKVVVTDALSRVLFLKDITSADKSVEIPSANFQNGVYYVRVIDEKGVKTTKFIKQ